MNSKSVKYKMFTRLFLLLFFISGVGFQAVSQNISVSGLVTDKTEEPLLGVSIKVEGAATGTVTDLDGKFTLNCPSGSMLDISYIGFVSQKVKAQNNLKIVLIEDAVALDEAVVVGIGYGTMRKSDLTGAIASVSQKDFKQGVVTSAEQLLQGKIAGLSVSQSSGDPSVGASVRLRGGTSLSAGNAPLVVIDGIPGVDMNTVQPSEIVSIDVLKDASASAIYGSRGANGVIIVTTSRSAADREKSSVEFMFVKIMF